jgi:LPS export ABC transporter permease LptG
VNFAILTKNSEINAIKAGGVSLYRISVPIVMSGIVVSLVCFGLQEYILPYSNRRAEELEDEIKERASQTRNLLDRRWMLGRNQQIYHYTYYDPPRMLFNGLAVYRFNESSFKLTERLYADQAGWDPSAGGWVFRNGWQRNFDEQAEVRRFDELVVRDMELPDYFVKEEKQSDQMTFYELSRYMRDLSQSGFDVVRFEVALQSKLAFPLAALITAIIGVPFSFTPRKKGALYGIGVAIVIGLSYYVTTRVFAYMGNSAMLPPLMAAWAPNVLFGVGALYGLFNVRT